MRVGIVGGSIAGCAAAALLHRAGHDVIVFERSGSDLVSRGAGIGTPTAVWQDMMARGLIDETLPAFRIDSMRFVTRGSGTGQQRWLGDVQPPAEPRRWSTGPICTSGFGGASPTSCTAVPRPSS